MALVLGTAQIGNKYGIANKTGKPDQDMVQEIIKAAWDCGIKEIDTAQAYGDSEKYLGCALAELGLSKKMQIVTKFSPSVAHLDAKEMKDALDLSLDRLGVEKVHGVMLHREDMLEIWESGLSDILKSFLRSGKVANLGVSVYSPEMAIDALNMEGISLVQLPTNILDKRFEQAGVFELAQKKDKQIYIRSVFLQGLILMQASELSKNMMFAKDTLKQIEDMAQEFSMGRHQLALGYVKNKYPNAKIIFGAETVNQVKENAQLWGKTYPKNATNRIENTFSTVDGQIINPALWPN